MRRLRRAIPPVSTERLFVLVAASGLVVTYILTWSLWQPRVNPPNLPAAGLPLWAFGVPLVVAAAASALLPRVGAVAHGALLVLAVLADQIRLQPEVVSLAILLLAAAWPRSGTHVARWHLITLWFWSGFNKALSGGWPSGAAVFIASSLGLVRLSALVAVVVPLTEIGLAVLGLRPSTWRFLRWAAAAFHLGTFATLALTRWNTAVYPWNIALAAAALLVFTRPASSRPAALPSGRRGALLGAVAVVLVLYPAGFYFGITDTYMAHNLYTSNTADAYVCQADARRLRCDEPLGSVTYEKLNVPLPPEKRVFDAMFDRTCFGDQLLRVDGSWVRWADRDTTFRPCPAD